MRWHMGLMLAVWGALLGGAGVRAADQAGVVKEQKETAVAIWKQMYGDEAPATEETAHFLLFGPGPMTPKQLRDLGNALEARASLARTPLKIDAKEELWAGKLTVFLIDNHRHFGTFMRTVAKQRPSADVSGVFSLKAPNPYIAACPPQRKFDPTLELQAGEQLVAALVTKRGGEALPEWVVGGFAKATAWRAAPNSYYNERTQVKKLIRGHTAADVWNSKLNAEESALLRASLMEFLAYGPGATHFLKFVEGFRPGANGQAKTTMDALKAAQFDPEGLNKGWLSWVARWR